MYSICDARIELSLVITYYCLRLATENSRTWDGEEARPCLVRQNFSLAVVIFSFLFDNYYSIID